MDGSARATPSTTAAVRAAWADLGVLGRVLLTVFGLAVIAAVILAQTVPAQVERAIIDSELRLLSGVGDQLERSGALPDEGVIAAAGVELDDFVRSNLHGHDAVRTKIWSSEGTIVYSDEPSLIGDSYPEEFGFTSAVQGQPIAVRPDPRAEENRSEVGLDPTWEFYVPVLSSAGEVRAVFEVYHLSEPFDATVASVWRYVTWSSIAGVALVAALVLAIMVAQGRRAISQQHHAESLFGDLVRAQGDERKRIIGALHDDIGQPLYRIHYGLQDLASRSGDGLEQELDVIDGLVLDVDQALRQELRTLQDGPAEELRLDAALLHLAELTESESGLELVLDIDPACSRGGMGSVALYRAAREAITNVRKHSGATTTHVTVTRKADRVELQVRDDGAGGKIDEGVGLAVVREQLEALGGGLQVKSRRGRGTSVKGWLPATVCGVDA